MSGNGVQRRRYRVSRKKKKRAWRLFLSVVLLLGCVKIFLDFAGVQQSAAGAIRSKTIVQELEDMLDNNQEAADFVAGYPERDNYIDQPIDLSEDFEPGTVPLLMQWDKRWGYDAYGDSIIGLSGCGPTCLTMAYLYFTQDTSVNPRTMAEYAYDNGYYTAEGTSWSLWTEGAEALGLQGEVLPLDENSMEKVLDGGGLIVCSMRPGDFTTTGHFILIKGYDDKGFFINDPNRRSHSQRQWSYSDLSRQIKNLWGLWAQ